MGDCEECSPGCYEGWVGNMICNPLCMVPECNYDQGDCQIDNMCETNTQGTKKRV
jgi:hypothetical protein